MTGGQPVGGLHRLLVVVPDRDDDLDLGVVLPQQGAQGRLHDDLLLLTARHDQREGVPGLVERTGLVAGQVGLATTLGVPGPVVVLRQPPGMHLPPEGG